MLDQGDMSTHLTLCCAENWHQLYSYSVPSLSLLSSHVVSDADFTFFFSKFLHPVNITTSVKSSDLYNSISQCLKGLSESGLLFSECTRCWLWCEEHQAISDPSSPCSPCSVTAHHLLSFSATTVCGAALQTGSVILV